MIEKHYPEFEQWSSRKTNTILSVLAVARLVSGAVGVLIVTKASEVSFTMWSTLFHPALWTTVLCILAAGLMTYWIRWIEAGTDAV